MSSLRLLAVFGIGYVGLLLTGFVLSFTTRHQARRRILRVATAVLSVPALLVATFVAFLRLTVFREPPGLLELQGHFNFERTDLETLVGMSDEDVSFPRIAPDFLDRTSGNQEGRYMAGDPKAGLDKDRWEKYRRIYSRNAIKLGISRDTFGDVFIMVDSVGILERGHTSGYLHCASMGPVKTFRFEPCILHQENGDQRSNPVTREEGYSYQKLAEGWYAYDEGPG